MNSARTAGPIVTDEAPFDSPIRRNEDGADLGSISSRWHVARAAPSRLAKKNRTHLQVKRGQPLNPNSQVTSVLYQLKIHSGCRFCGVPAARARGEEVVLTWGPPLKVNFELATPNSVHGCTLARPTWRRMIYWAGVHCARGVHAQVVCIF